MQPGSESKKNLYSPPGPSLYLPQVTLCPKLWIESQAEDKRVSFSLLSLYSCPLFAPASLGHISHQWLGQEAELYQCLKAYLPPRPFVSFPLGVWSSPGSPGSSLVVLFSTACPSSGPLLCGLSLWETVYQVALVSTVQSSGFSILRGDTHWKLSPELSPLGVWPLGGLVFQRSRPPCSAKVLSQMTWSSERPNSCGLALWQSGSLWSGPLGHLSSQSAGSCILACREQLLLGLRPLGVWSSRSCVSCRQVPSKVCSPRSGSLVSLFSTACLSDGVGSCGAALL